MKLQRYGTCVENPFGDIGVLVGVAEKGRTISRKTFLKHCNVSPEELVLMREYPNSYEFCKSSVPFSKQIVYFYTWSAIEHFYM